jgi:hypothetical protein
MGQFQLLYRRLSLLHQIYFMYLDRVILLYQVAKNCGLISIALSYAFIASSYLFNYCRATLLQCQIKKDPKDVEE